MAIRRQELEELSREDLVQRANELGVPRAASLTRLDLLDEIVAASAQDEQERTAARGLLGLARDLVARVMEKGLHLPDAASRLRTLGPTSPTARKGPAPLATVALAEVYANQGHRAVALEVIDDVLRREPHNQAAVALRHRLVHALAPGEDRRPDRAPDIAPEPPQRLEPDASGDQPRTPARPQADHLALEPRGKGHARLLWRVRPASFVRARVQQPEGRLVLRIVHVLPHAAGPDVRTEDIEVDALAGRVQVALAAEPRSTCAAIGWRVGDRFEVFATDSGC